MRLKDQVAVITGATSGIGAESARRFVEEGAKVLIADMQDEKGQAMAEELGDATAFLTRRCVSGAARRGCPRRDRGPQKSQRLVDLVEPLVGVLVDAGVVAAKWPPPKLPR